MKTTIKFFTAILTFSFLVSCTGRFEDAADKASAYKNYVNTISAAELNLKLIDDADFTLIDVRQPEAFSADYIPGAISLPRGNLEFLIDDEEYWTAQNKTVPGKEEPLILYSTQGNNAVLAATTLMQLGYENVLTLDGGLKSFKEDKTAYASSEAYHALAEYLQAEGRDLPAIIDKGVVGAKVVSEDLDAYYIIDIRSKEDFEKGHIEGAVNYNEKDVLQAAKNAGDKKIVVVCYTGQKAAYASVLLRMSGYNSQIMKWGMSSWGPSFDKWSPNTSNHAIGHENWSTEMDLERAPLFNYPEIAAVSTDGEAILKERVQYALEKGLQTITTEEVLAEPSNYYLANYWPENVVEKYGHIKGAYRLNESLSHADPAGFRNLDPKAVVVPHCWTGQTSAMVSAYLTVLGYDAKSLFFGSNAMIEQNLEMNRWHGEKPAKDFPFVK